MILIICDLHRAVVQLSSIRTHNARVASSNPTRVTIKTVGKEDNGKAPHRFHFHRKKLIALFLVSATLEIEYAMHFMILDSYGL